MPYLDWAGKDDALRGLSTKEEESLLSESDKDRLSTVTQGQNMIIEGELVI